jgi:hypothetical protein
MMARVFVPGKADVRAEIPKVVFPPNRQRRPARKDTPPAAGTAYSTLPRRSSPGAKTAAGIDPRCAPCEQGGTRSVMAKTILR